MSNNDEQVNIALQSEQHDEINMLSDSAELASRGTRLGAAFLDTFILVLFFIPGLVIFSLMGGDFSNPDQAQLMKNIYTYCALFIIIYMVINGVLLYKYGQTIAKRLLNIKIVRTDGERIGFKRLLGLRIVLIQLLYQVPVVGFLFMIVNVLFIFREDQRCIHDLIANTKVVST
jgi:uncharacterized RDD family membrane protein YckC